VSTALVLSVVLLRHTAVGLVVYASLLVLTWVGFNRVPTGFISEQDQGYLFGLFPTPIFYVVIRRFSER
jgi:multidrug efflux pump subunit AcrB